MENGGERGKILLKFNQRKKNVTIIITSVRFNHYAAYKMKSTIFLNIDQTTKSELMHCE
jgi:hypothetical protein